MTKEFNPMEELKRQLTLPVCKDGSDEYFKAEGEIFDPWEIFPCFYGSYSSAFDEMAIEVLEAIQNRASFVGESLAHEMFREVLCTSGFCDYGTSPRGCFPDRRTDFAELLPTLIEKWKQYYTVEWGDAL